MRRLLIILLGLFLVFQLNGQTFYINPGMSISKVKFEYKPMGFSEQHYKDPLFSYAGSVGVEYLERKNFSLSTEILFYESGGKVSEEEKEGQSITNIYDKAALTYMSLGTYFNFNPIDKAFKLQIQIGPRIDYVIGGFEEGAYRYIDKQEELSRFNFGFSFGIGTYYNIKQFVVGIKAQYLNKIKKTADFETPYSYHYSLMGAEVSEQVFLLNFSFGYSLSPKKKK